MITAAGSFLITQGTLANRNYAITFIPGTLRVPEGPLTVTASGISSAVAGQSTGTVVVATFTDAGPNEQPGDYEATITWGDGTRSSADNISGSNGRFTVTGHHVYAQAGHYGLAVFVQGLGSASAADAALATVVAPAFSGSVASLSNLFEMQPTGRVTVARFIDPNSNDPAGIFTVAIDWGDGLTSVGSVSGSGGTFTVTGGTTYADPDTYTIRVQVFAADGRSTTLSGSVTVQDAPLTIMVDNIQATEGEPFSGAVATFTDANPYAVAQDFQATIVWGDAHSDPGTVSAGANGQFTVTTINPHTYAEDGPQTLSVQIDDLGGGSNTTASTPISVADAALTANGEDINTMAGQSTGTVVVATFTDANTQAPVTDFTATIDWGDNSAGDTGTVVATEGGGFNVTGNHTYNDGGSYDVTVQINDIGGSTATANGTAAVGLTVTGVHIETAEGDTTEQYVAEFTAGNPGAQAGDFSAFIAWGDGHTSAGRVQDGGGGNFSVYGNPPYTDETEPDQPYTFAVTVTQGRERNGQRHRPGRRLRQLGAYRRGPQFADGPTGRGGQLHRYQQPQRRSERLLGDLHLARRQWRRPDLRGWRWLLLADGPGMAESGDLQLQPDHQRQSARHRDCHYHRHDGDQSRLPGHRPGVGRHLARPGRHADRPRPGGDVHRRQPHGLGRGLQRRHQLGRRLQPRGRPRHGYRPLLGLQHRRPHLVPDGLVPHHRHGDRRRQRRPDHPQHGGH